MVTTKTIAKVAAVATGLAMATSMLSFAPIANAASLTSAQVQSILSLLSSFGANSGTIANVNAALTGGTMTTSGSTTTTSASSCSFSGALTIGSSGATVTCLQNALIAGGYSIPAGATGYFGGQTQAAVAAWQKAVGVSPAAGYFGAISQAHWNLGGGSSSSTTTTTTTTTTGTTSGTTAYTGTGTGLKVMLSPTSPNGSVLVQGQGIGDLGDYVFANPTATPINVTGLNFMRTGVSNDATLVNVYLYNAGTRITDSAGVSSSAFSYSNPAGLFTVPANSTYTLTVRSDIAGSSSGQQIGTELVSVTSSGTLDPSVSLPIYSGYQTVSAANLATVNFPASVSPAQTTISPQSGFPLWQDTITVSVNPVRLSSMRFTNLGSINTTYLTNLQLFVDGVQVGSTLPTMNGATTVTFDLSANPLLLSTASHTIKVLANVTGGAARTIQFSVQRSSDAMFIDNQLNQPITPTYNGLTWSAATAGAITINSVSATQGVSVSLDPATPSQAVSFSSTGVKWATYDMLASGENVKVSDLYVCANYANYAGGLANGQITVNGVQVGSTKTIVGAASNCSTGTDFSLGSSLILPAGQTTVVSVIADARDVTNSLYPASGATVTMTLLAATSNGQGQSSLQSANVPSSSTSGLGVPVSTSSLTATAYSGYGSQTLIAGSNNVKLGAFALAAGATEGINVNTIVVSIPTSVNAASITNLTLKDDATGTVLGSVITTPSTSNNFAVNYPLSVSQTKVIDVYGNIISGSGIGPIQLTVVNTTTSGTGAVTGASAVLAVSAPLQTITIGAGTLTVTRGAGDPVSANVLAGASSVLAGDFNFAAQNSAYTVNNVAIVVPRSVASAVNAITLSYKDVNGVTQTAQAYLAVNQSLVNATATFTGLTMYVPSGSNADLLAYVSTPTIASGGSSYNISGLGVNLALDTANDTLFRAVNGAGAPLATINSGVNITSGGTLYVRGSIATFGVPAGQGGNFVPSNPLYRFTISADPAGAIEWTRLNFTISTTSTTLSNVYLVDESTGNNLLDNKTTSASSTATGFLVDLTKNATVAQSQLVAAGSTKTYDFDGTISAFGTGAGLTISLAQDNGNPAANGTATAVSGNVVWSDRSASPHTSPAVGVPSSSDFTNGALLKNFTTNSVSYSK